MAAKDGTMFFCLNFKQHKHLCGIPAYMPDDLWPGDDHYDRVANQNDRAARKLFKILAGDIFFRWCREDPTDGIMHIRQYRALQDTWGVVSRVASFILPDGFHDPNGSEGGGFQVQILRSQVPFEVQIGSQTPYFIVEKVPSAQNVWVDQEQAVDAWFIAHENPNRFELIPPNDSHGFVFLP